jgi:hypothetical protein
MALVYKAYPQAQVKRIFIFKMPFGETVVHVYA